MTRWRFDMVVFNYKKVTAFTENTWRLKNLTARDRVSFLSASPSEEEAAILQKWAAESGVNCRYYPRQNRGLSELARFEYYFGECGEADNLDSRFMFTMQDHYLDTTSPWSIWGARFDYKVKGDVVPDEITFDLDDIEARMDRERCVAAFADRHGGAWIEVDGAPHIAPSGGNFIVRTEQISRPEIQGTMRHLKRVCDDTYWWGLYSEFMCGPLFFREGFPVLDLKTNRVLTTFPRSEHYVAPDDFAHLHRVYAKTLLGWALRSYYALRRTAGRSKLLRRLWSKRLT